MPESIRIRRSMVRVVEGAESKDGLVAMGSLVEVIHQLSPFYGHYGHIAARSKEEVWIVGLSRLHNAYARRFARAKDWHEIAAKREGA